MKNTTLSEPVEAKMKEEANQLISRWREEKINYFGTVNRELVEKKKKKPGFPGTSKKTKAPVFLLTVIVLGGYRMWLLTVPSQDANQKQSDGGETVEIHYLDIVSISYDETTSRIEISLNPDVKSGKYDADSYVIFANNCQKIVAQIQLCYHDIAGATPLQIVGKQIPVSNPFFPDCSTALFLRMYKSYCNYYGIEPDILVPSLLKQFRLRGNTEIEIPTMPGASAFQDNYASPIGPYIRALQYDTYFTSLVLYSQVNRKETLDEVAKVVRHNKNLLKIVLTDIETENNSAFNELSNALYHNSGSSRLQILNMSNNFIGKYFDNIVKAIANISTLTYLSFSRCKIPCSCISDLFKLLLHNDKTVQGLKYLDLSHNLPWDIETHHSASSFFRVYNSRLKLEVLKLAGINLNMTTLLEIRGISTLKELDIGYNFLNTTAQQTALESYLDGASSLQIINLSKCDFGGQQTQTQRDGVQTLKTLFLKSPNIKEIELHFSENTNFHSSLIEVLSGATVKLTSLNLSNSRIKDVTLIDILKLIPKLPNIVSFNIENGSDEQPAPLEVGKSLAELPSSKSLQELNCATGFGKECTVCLLQGIKKHANTHNITKLDISNNMLGNRGALAIAEVLLVETKLKFLSCDNNSISYNGWNAIYVALKGNQKCSLKQIMWPSFDVHKVMVEQTELTKKHDFFFLLNQIQTRLLSHSKKPFCPENGFGSNSSGYDKDIPLAPLDPEVPLSRPDDNPFECNDSAVKEDETARVDQPGKQEPPNDLLTGLLLRDKAVKNKIIYRNTKNHSNGYPLPVVNPGTYKEEKGGAKKTLPAVSLYNPFFVLGSRMIPNEEDYYFIEDSSTND